MQLADAPNLGAFRTGIRVINPSDAPITGKLVIIGGGKRKDVPLTLAAYDTTSFMLSAHVADGTYGVCLIGGLTGVAQYSQSGRYYDAAQIPTYG